MKSVRRSSSFVASALRWFLAFSIPASVLPWPGRLLSTSAWGVVDKTGAAWTASAGWSNLSTEWLPHCAPVQSMRYGWSVLSGKRMTFCLSFP